MPQKQNEKRNANIERKPYDAFLFVRALVPNTEYASFPNVRAVDSNTELSGMHFLLRSIRRFQVFVLWSLMRNYLACTEAILARGTHWADADKQVLCPNLSWVQILQDV